MWHHDIQATAARHDELRQEAANVRLLQQSRRVQTKRISQSWLLDQLGRRLIAWGWRLRARYGSLETVEHRQLEY